MCEGGIDKSDPRITDWHHEACRVMADGDHEGRIFLSLPHTNNGFFFLLTTHFILERREKVSRKSWICRDVKWWRHFNITIASRIDVRPACGWEAAVRFFYLSNGLVRVCEIELSHIGKSNGNPNLVCENNCGLWLLLFLAPKLWKSTQLNMKIQLLITT